MSPELPRPTPAEREEMVELLPMPADRELPGGRHQLLKEHLMREVRQYATTDEAASRPGPRPLGRRLAVAGVPLAAGAVAVVLVVTGVRDDRLADGSGSGVASSGPSTGGTRTLSAGVLLNRIAVTAAAQPAPAVRDDQFIHIVSTVAPTMGRGPAGTLSAEPHTREIWLSADGSRPGLLRENGTRSPLDAHSKPSLNEPTYRYLESLPTDPGRLLAKIYDETRGMGNGPHDEAFVTIGDLLREQIAPPKVSAALYRAAARIPGVTVVDRAVDAAGRRGVAVARADDGKRTEWIFDKVTLRFLGERTVMTENSAAAKKGQVIDDAAVLSRAVTDRAGQTSGQAS